MASIAQAQAAFLQAGGLKTGGIDKPAMNQVDPMQEMLSKYIVEFLNTASDNLNKTNSITTGNLENSLDFDITRTTGGYRIDFKALEYFKFVDKGVRGKGSSEKNKTSPYSFKYINPSKSHVEAIKKWITDNNLTAQVTDIKRWGTYKSREAKGKNMPLKSAAWLVARNIKRKGLRATNFWSDAFDQTFKDFGQKMSAALGKTITVNLEQMKEDLANFKGKGAGKGVKIPTI
jgi:hypothetical protein